jgi:hypothetical protein
VINADGVRLGFGDATLTFQAIESALPADEMVVTLDVLDLHASRRVELHEAWPSLSEFFRSLSASWRGWEGPREWVSIDRDLRLSCTHNGIGHVVITVSIGLLPPFEWHLPGWYATATVVVDPGALEAFAGALEKELGGR